MSPPTIPGRFSQLGDNSLVTRRTPTSVLLPVDVTHVTAGGVHVLAVTDQEELYAWGDNLYGQLGDTSTTDRRVPVLVALANVVSVAAGEFHSVALTADGRVFTWGRNNLGQLGNGGIQNQPAPVEVLSGAIAVAAGKSHTLAVMSDGTVMGWGQNTNGQLGDGTTTSPRLTPVQMAGISGAVAVTAGDRHSVVVLANGTLAAVGVNSSGQLGNASTAPSTIPVAVGGLEGVIAARAGGDHTLALLSDGSVWAWGENGDGQLGTGGTTDRSSPAQVATLPSVSAVGAGLEHSLAVSVDGIVFTWGRNASGQLGDGTLVARDLPESISAQNYAWRVATPTFSVAPGTYTSERSVVVAVETAGATIHYTRDGSAPTEADATVASGATLVVDSSQTLRALAVKAGVPASAIATATYTLKVATPSISPSSGTYSSERLVSISTVTGSASIRFTLDGSAPTEQSTLYVEPFTVATTTAVKAVAVREGWTTSDVRTNTYTMNFGTLAAPGLSPAGGTHVGSVVVEMAAPLAGATVRYTTNGSTPTASSPAYSGPFTLTTSAVVRAKAYHPDYTASPESSATFTIRAVAPVLDPPGGLVAAGSVVTISTSEAGATLRYTIDGSEPGTASPVIASGDAIAAGHFTVRARSFRSGVDASDVAEETYQLQGALGPGAAAAGAEHSLLATPDGRLFVWGSNGSGRLGDGTVTMRASPTLLQTLTGVTSVATGSAHSLASTWDGRLYAWGNNGSGRLGDGTTSQRTSPVLLALPGVVSVAAGDAHSLALVADGRVFAWGVNSSGQLGIGSTLAQHTPVEVPGLSNVVSIAAGSSHSLAVTADGQLYAWGANGSSRLGDGSTTNRPSPVLIGLSSIDAVAAGATHSLALRRDGTVYAWGAGSNGQLGLGGTSPATTPTRIPGLHASAIAAGANHSGAVAIDGSLVAWGLNTSGQLGDGSLDSRLVPTPVQGGADASAVALGTAHSIAASHDGQVSTWGAGASGRLGDGGTSNRSQPAVVLSGLTLWRPAAPALTLASGTFHGGFGVGISTSLPDAIVRYTLNGETPTEASAEVPSGGIVDVSSTSMLRARVFAPGRAAGAVARADYELQAAAPVIDPPGGLFGTPQVVIISGAAPGDTIRYTVDGTEPDGSSTAYTGPIGVSTSQILKARVFSGAGWSASATASASFVFNYGTLEPPYAAPPGGAYQQIPEVQLWATEGASIRYTLDGSEPTEASALYSAAVALPPGGGTLKARAYRQDWTPSSTMVETYAVDTVPPTITASTFPALLSGWSSTPVTVTFRCFDASGVASCTSPVTFAEEGSGQEAVGTAVDTAGNQANASVIVGLDFTPPVLALAEPQDGLTTSADSILVTGTVSDALSGLAAVTCNGVPATVTGDVATCTVPLRPGRNSVVLQARDYAGHSVSAGVRVTRVGTVTLLAMAPAERTLLVDESATLTLRDDFGVQVHEATWMSSDPLIVTLSADDPPVVTAVGPGTATVTAVKNGLSAEATVTVMAGSSLAEGTVRWAVAAPTGAPHVRPLYTHRVAPDVPDLFLVETDADWQERVHALDAQGNALWTEVAPGSVLMGDSFGALIAQIDLPDGHHLGLARFAVPDGVAPWRYEAPFALTDPAQAPDGTIYAIEVVPNGTDSDGWAQFDKVAVVIDGATGRLVSRTPLPRESYVFDSARDGQQLGNGVTCRSRWYHDGAETVGPVVGDDGRGYLLVRRRLHEETGSCVSSSSTNYRQAAVGVDLVVMSPSGGVTATSLQDLTCPLGPVTSNTMCDVLPLVQQLVPDGLGGILARWRLTTGLEPAFPHNSIRQTMVTRVVGEARTDWPVSTSTAITMTGEAGVAYVDGSRQAVDVTTWQPLWTFAAPGVPVAALMDNGVALYDHYTGTFSEVGSSGVTLASVSLDLAWPQQTRFGMWTGTRGTGPAQRLATVVGAPLNEVHRSFVVGSGAVSAWGAFSGSRTNQNAASVRGRHQSAEVVALRALEYVFPLSVGVRREIGGRVCAEASGTYRWGRFSVGGPDSVQSNLNVEECADAATTVAFLHTHWEGPYYRTLPSGYASQAEYDHPDGSDLRLSDVFPGIVFYMASLNCAPGQLTCDEDNGTLLSPIRFWRFQGPLSKNNIWFLASDWMKLPDATW